MSNTTTNRSPPTKLPTLSKAINPLYLPLSFMAPCIEELSFPALDIPVNVDRMSMVMPAGPIPVSSGDTLYLSNLDDMIGTRVFTPTVYFYQSNSLNADRRLVIQSFRNSLAAVLVPYYPFSGRLRETPNGKLEVFFGSDRGALMVEARSELALADLGDLAVPNPAWLPLIYRFADEGPYKVTGMPLVIAQVTHFSCGGFSLGLRLCHCLCDGFGAMQFLRAWSATANASGVLVAEPPPCWDREFFRPRDPPLVKYPHAEFKNIEDGSNLVASLWRAKPVQKCYRLSRNFQARLKALVQMGGDGFACTGFDAIAAHVWRSWVKALEVEPRETELRLTFSVNARKKLKNPPLRNGFYGNVVCVGCVMRKVSELLNGSLSDAAQLVREARVGITEEYLRSTVDYVEVDRPKRLEFGGKLTITQWTRFSIYESADFGWGRPIYAGPIDLTPTPQVCLFLPEGGEAAEESGAMVLCICLPDAAAERFKELFSMVNQSFK